MIRYDDYISSARNRSASLPSRQGRAGERDPDQQQGVGFRNLGSSNGNSDTERIVRRAKRQARRIMERQH